MHKVGVLGTQCAMSVGCMLPPHVRFHVNEVLLVIRRSLLRERSLCRLHSVEVLLFAGSKVVRSR
jgi:hypothetical protein